MIEQLRIGAHVFSSDGKQVGSLSRNVVSGADLMVTELVVDPGPHLSELLEPGGHLLFTAPAQAGTWRDAMTGLESVSLGAERYRTLLTDAGISVVDEYEDGGENHYFEARRT